MAVVKLTPEQRATKLLLARLNRIAGPLHAAVHSRANDAELFGALRELERVIADVRSGAISVRREATVTRGMGVA